MKRITVRDVFTRRPTTTIAEQVKPFEGYLARTHARTTTIKYVAAVERFAQAYGSRATGAVSAADIDSYLGDWNSEFELRYGRPPSRDTYRNQVTALKTFYDYLDRTGRIVDARGRATANPMLRVETPVRTQKPINWLDREEDLALLAYRGEPREEFIIWLLRHTGVRVGEARELRISDLDLTPGGECVHVPVSKTRAGIREIPLTPELVARVKEWLDHLREAGLYRVGGPLLPTRNGTAMHTTQIARTLKRAAAAAGVRCVDCTCGSTLLGWHAKGCPRTANGEQRSEITPQTLRRTFGSALLNRGMRIEGVSKLLGHSSVAVTQAAYAELLPVTVRDEYLAVYGYRSAA